MQCHLRHLGMGLRSLKALRVFVGTFMRSYLAWQMALLISGRGAWQGHSSIKGREGKGVFKELGRYDGNLDVAPSVQAESA